MQLWGEGDRDSRSPGARKIRKVARELFAADAPGKGGEWHLTPSQVDAIRAELVAHAARSPS